jgi:hypothetical protein
MPWATGITIVGTPNDPARTMPGARNGSMRATARRA